MIVKFLGTHHSESKTTRLVSILIDDILAVDAGSIASELTFDEQRKVKAILLTHEHYDHIRGVPSFVFSNLHQTTNVYSTPQTLDIVSSHLFDGEIYPKFTEKTPFLKKPPIKLIPINPYDTINVDGYKVLALPANHTESSIGYEITANDGKKVFYTGDTGPGLSENWEKIKPDLLIIDLTFPNKMKESAKNAGHLCPDMLYEELNEFKRLNNYIPRVALIHLSPKYEKEINQEIKNVSKELNTQINIAIEGDKIII